MDEEKYLVFVKDEDKTAQIQSFETRDSVIWITYRYSEKEYPCAKRDFLFFNNPDVTQVAGQIIYHNDIPLNNVSKVIRFGSKTRVTFRRGPSCIFDSNTIRVGIKDTTSEEAKSILRYWTTISQHTNSEDSSPNEEAFLKKQFKKLTVNPESVLAYYLNGEPVKSFSPVVQDTIFPFQFNLSQKEALDNALKSQVSVVEGPPGTGKTQTILNILANLVVMQNKKVAVVSGNNAAVDNVREKLESKGYAFLVAALGNNKNKKLFFDKLPNRDVSEWKCEVDEQDLLVRIKNLNNRIDQLMMKEKQKAQLQQELSNYELEREHFEVYYNKQNIGQIRKLSFYRQTPEKILSFLVDNQVALERGKENSFIHKLKLVIRHGFTDFKRLQGNEIDLVLSLQRKYYQLKVEQLKDHIETIELELKRSSYNSLLKEHQQVSEKLFRHKLYKQYYYQLPLRVSADSYKNQFDKFIEQYPIMLSTTHSLRTCVPENYLFDYVIVDESSQVDLLTGALALSCCKNVIIVGDLKQLPQIVDETIEDKLGDIGSEIGYCYQYFEHNLLSSVVGLYGNALPKVMLREHYRCHPKIIEFCNKKYYDGELIAFTSENEGDRPLLIYRTVEGNHMREITHGRRGKFNQRELDVIQQEVLVNLEFAIERNSDIGFTTPYRRQVEKAADQLVEDIESDTIHKYQGREKPIMILSTVLDRSRSGKKGLQFVNDPRMINVAVSRAQQQFILVTDHSLFRKFGTEIGDLIRYMEYSTLDDNLIDSEIVSVFDLLYKDYSEKLRSFKGRLLQRSKYASENIMWTLLEDLIQEAPYKGLTCGGQIILKNLFHDLSKLTDYERDYVNNRASVDFVLYHGLDKKPIIAIEVDGFEYHENNLRQQERDLLKDSIFKKKGLPLLRLPTTGSGEVEKIRMMLNEIMQK